MLMSGCAGAMFGEYASSGFEARVERVLGLASGVVLCPRRTVVNVWGADIVCVWTEAMVCGCL
jgi:hypothetical protein